MHKFWSALLALTLLKMAPAAAQQPIPPLKQEFLDSTYRVLPGAAGARYRRETEYTDSVTGSQKVYYLTGKLISQQSFENLRKRTLSGVSEWWYPNGQLHIREEYLHGRRMGELRTYYPGGQLKRREVFDLKDDFTSTGECFAETGEVIPFFKFEQMPLYPEGDGGNRMIVRAIQRGVKYPREALKARCSGRAVVGFTVTARGEVADIRILQRVCPSIDAAVLEAVRRLKPFKPGQQDGQAVSVGFSVPITFALP